jgi:hypothetical protein
MDSISAPMDTASKINDLQQLLPNPKTRVDGSIRIVLTKLRIATVVTSAQSATLHLEQAFVAFASPLGSGVIKLRIGRQEMAFDCRDLSLCVTAQTARYLGIRRHLESSFDL